MGSHWKPISASRVGLLEGWPIGVRGTAQDSPLTLFERVSARSTDIQRGLFQLYKGFLYQAASWKKARRAVAKVEHHPGELLP